MFSGNFLVYLTILSYKEVHNNEILTNSNIVITTDNDIEYIRSNIKHRIFIQSWVPWNMMENCHKYNELRIFLGDNDHKHPEISIIVTKLEDDYFFVKVNRDFRKYYVCDQIEGLLELLNTVTRIPKKIRSIFKKSQNV